VVSDLGGRWSTKDSWIIPLIELTTIARQIDKEIEKAMKAILRAKNEYNCGNKMAIGLFAIDI
jgi:hypothetical protein